MIRLMLPWRNRLISVVLSCLLFLTACAPKSPSPYAQVQKETTRWGAPSAVAKDAAKGGTFNQFFPRGPKGYDVVPAQEKKGFAEYKVNKDGKTVAMLSINDTTSIPSAATKYNLSTFKVGNYPAIDQGATATALLVSDRYQVKVLSRDPSFTRDDRIAWLQQFDLQGLAKLKGAPEAKAPVVSGSQARNLPSPRPRLLPQPAA